MYSVTIKLTNAIIHKEKSGKCHNYEDIKRRLKELSATFDIETVTLDEDVVSDFTHEQIASYQMVGKTVLKGDSFENEDKEVTIQGKPKGGVKQLIWGVYFIAMLVLTIISIPMIIGGELLSLTSFISLVFGIFLLIGLYGYVFHEKIYKRQTWVIISWLVVVSLILQFIFLFVTFGVFLLPFLVINLIQGPMYYAIFKYSSINNKIWAKTINKVYSDVHELLKSKGSLSKSSLVADDNDSLVFTATMTEAGDTILVNIEKKLNGEVKKSSSAFANIRAVEEYIEKHTNIKFTDFLLKK